MSWDGSSRPVSPRATIPDDRGVQRFFCLRFDVDTELCLREGTPQLRALARATNAKFTFFVNPGRAIHRGQSLTAALQRRRAENSGARFRPYEKLGRTEWLRLLAENPNALPRQGSEVKRLLDDGHDIGLHGGRNHASWQRNAHLWPVSRLADEIEFGLERLSRILPTRPTLFASPGWNSPPVLGKLLAARGFRLLADDHGRHGVPTTLNGWSEMLSAPTALSGEPGGVGFIEHHRARGWQDERLLAELSGVLAAGHPFICLYDHPFYAGRMEKALLEKIIRLAQSRHYTITTMTEAARSLCPEW